MINEKNKQFTLALVVLIFLFINLNLARVAPIVPILGFHGIIGSEPFPSSAEIDYPQEDLEKVLEYFIVNNYWFLTAQDLHDFFLTKFYKIPREHLKQKPIMISFDDGYKTVNTNLLPILSKLEEQYGKKVKVVLFINPGTLATSESSDSTHLGCEELREGLKRSFYDIQSHGQNHKKLTRLPAHSLVEELLQAQSELRKCTEDLDPEQKVASHLAYPYGAYNQQVVKYASKYYQSSYTYNNQILNHGCLKNYYQIPRLTVNRQQSAQQLIEMVSAKSDMC